MSETANKESASWTTTVLLVLAFVCFQLAVARLLTSGTPLTESPFLWGSAAALCAAAYLNRHELARSYRQRSIWYEANNNIMIASALGVLVLANIIVARWDERCFLLPRLDLTRNRFHSLSPQTLKILAGLDRPVEITALYLDPSGSRREDRVLRRRRERIDLLLRRYAKASPLVRYEIYDPERNPTIARRLGVKEPNTIVLRCGKRKVVLHQWAVFVPGDPSGRIPPRFKGEQAVTSAILRLMEPMAPVVYFLVGHGERTPVDTSRKGYSRIAEFIRDDNYECIRINLLQTPVIPPDCRCLIVAAPTRELSEQEERILRKYVEDGRNAFFLFDVVVPRTFANILRSRGLVLTSNVVVDPKACYLGDPTMLVPTMNMHTITAKLISMDVQPVLPGACALGRKTGFLESINIRTLLQTSEKSWAEHDLRQFPPVFDARHDERGPVSVAYAVTTDLETIDSTHQKKRGECRLVVFGDADFASNEYAGYQGNVDLFMAALNWITGEADKIDIKPKEEAGPRVALEKNEAAMVVYVCVLLLPSIFVFAGMITWTTRRNG